VAVWATSFEMLEHADTDPQLIADLLANHFDPNKEYVLHIVDRGPDLKGFGENTFVPTWNNLQKPAKKYLDKKHHGAIDEVLNSEYQKKYAAHMDEYWKADLGEFDKAHQ